jgi:dipeptidyl aminopeptidase/acylaminoacyl peptidase
MALRCFRGQGRRWRRWLGGAVLVGLAAIAAGPARGEIISVGPDGLEPSPSSLGEADLTRLEQLLGVRQIELLSGPSPDGATVVVAVSSPNLPEERQIHFLNLRTGALSDAPALAYDLVNPDLPLRWVDNNTLRYVQQDPYGPWEIITVNRTTEIASRTQVYPTQTEEGEILGVSPDFSKLVVRVYGDEEDAIYAVLLPSLRRIELARLPQELSIQPPEWSAAGDRMVLVTAAGEERQLYDRTPNSPSLANPVVQDALGRLAPADNPFHQHNAVRVFDFAQAEPLVLALLAPEQGGDAFAAAGLSPAGDRLLVKRHRPSAVAGRSHPSYAFPASAYFQVLDLAGTVLDTIAADPLRGPLESAGQFWGRDRLLFWGTHGLNRHLYSYDLAERQLTPLPLPPGSVDPTAVETSADGRTVVYGFSSLTQPPELYLLTAGAEPRSLTSVNAEAAASNRVRVDEVSFETGAGLRSGLLVQPGGSAFPPVQMPIVVWQQGGPGASMANEFAAAVEMPLNLLPNFGLAVLVVPLAGREGFGPEQFRALADDQNFGQIDIREGADIVEQMVRRGWTTSGQVGVTGCSYGGYFAAQLIAQFPQRVGAANPQCTLLDTLTEWQLGYSSLLSYLMGQTPMEAPQAYLGASPLYSAAAVRTPTLLFHGADDFLQIDVARNFHDAIAANQVPVTLYAFEGVGHSLYGSSFQALAAQLQIEFFRQYLQP